MTLIRHIRHAASAESSPEKSEIVVPIFVGNKLAAELESESYFIDTFTKREQEFVEACGSDRQLSGKRITARLFFSPEAS
jgi:putative methionine-R-sulfoxide reductase with GAF domain